ncbi:hypothetical protein NEDG_01156 [Nematocida displodere]|uniref:Uncharacterized protein n=1 Tax=Nematocida displodere TaxID=1805483 RepID=A0A177EAQ7_9MICR|nr:hypothetical protein NEDG_01156 [Nematocida displodere]
MKQQEQRTDLPQTKMPGNTPEIPSTNKGADLYCLECADSDEEGTGPRSKEENPYLTAEFWQSEYFKRLVIENFILMGPLVLLTPFVKTCDFYSSKGSFAILLIYTLLGEEFLRNLANWCICMWAIEKKYRKEKKGILAKRRIALHLAMVSVFGAGLCVITYYIAKGDRELVELHAIWNKEGQWPEEGENPEVGLVHGLSLPVHSLVSVIYIYIVSLPTAIAIVLLDTMGGVAENRQDMEGGESFMWKMVFITATGILVSLGRQIKMAVVGHGFFKDITHVMLLLSALAFGYLSVFYAKELTLGRARMLQTYSRQNQVPKLKELGELSIIAFSMSLFVAPALYAILSA